MDYTPNVVSKRCFSLYLSIHGLRKNPGKFLTGGVFWKVLDFFQWKSGNPDAYRLTILQTNWEKQRTFTNINHNILYNVAMCQAIYQKGHRPIKHSRHKQSPKGICWRYWATLTFDLAFCWDFRWAEVRSKYRLKSKSKVISQDLGQICGLSTYLDRS